MYINHLSIHDLTRRSTGWEAGKNPDFSLSIHDLTRRSTITKLLDQARGGLSIHDLTRRSTTGGYRVLGMEVFQFTTSQGGRQTQALERIAKSSFNSRPHKEVDRDLDPGYFTPRSFNSRPHKEVDLDNGNLINTGKLSIHDLTRRSTY